MIHDIRKVKQVATTWSSLKKHRVLDFGETVQEVTEKGNEDVSHRDLYYRVKLPVSFYQSKHIVDERSFLIGKSHVFFSLFSPLKVQQVFLNHKWHLLTATRKTFHFACLLFMRKSLQIKLIHKLKNSLFEPECESYERRDLMCALKSKRLLYKHFRNANVL